jgi:anti-sigma factor RsiW
LNEQDHDTDLIGAYVLDALSPEEREAFASHLQDCATCQAVVAELRRVVDVLPLTCERAEPRDSVRNRLLNAVGDEPPTRPTVAPARARILRRRWLTGRRVWTGALGLAAAAAIAALAVSNANLRQNVQDEKKTVAALQATAKFQTEVSAALAAGASVSRVAGTAAAPTASAAMVQPPHGATAYLIVRGLRPTPASKVYQIWLLRGPTALRSAQVFRYSGIGPKIVPLPMATSGWRQAAVTLEKAPRGARGPTTTPVLAGNLRA